MASSTVCGNADAERPGTRSDPLKAALCCAALSVLAAPVAAADATERDVRVPVGDQSLVATLRTPDGPPAPVVLLLHGFTGSRDELKTDKVPQGVFGRTAERLAQRGFASLRIDFRGSGDSTSDLSFADTTFEGQVTDAQAAIRYLQSSPQVRGDQLLMIGWSQGGLVASAVAGRSKTVDALALWAAVSQPTTTFGLLFGDEILAAGLGLAPGEALNIELGWRPDIQLKRGFFEGVASFEPAVEIAAYSGPLLIAHGSKDDVVPRESVDHFAQAHRGARDFFMAEMDHVFNVNETDATLERLIDRTVTFFARYVD